MELIKDKEFEGERPLYVSNNLHLENVTVHAGESAIKESRNIEAINCRFEGKYPFWCNNGVKIKNCHFTEGARAAIWYSQNLEMVDTEVIAPKMFREIDGLKLKKVTMPNAAETLWHCKNVEIENVKIDKGDYLFMHGSHLRIKNLTLNGNYSFQYCNDVVIENSVLNTKDAFWNTENVTVINSEINGEYLAWYSNRLTLINCTISESQPLCYAENLVLKDCKLAKDADLAFEYSSVDAQIIGNVTSIKNPKSGKIVCDSVDEIIIDQNIKKPGDCIIEIRNK